MPRNPDKARCSVDGCRNWAMRGQARCRAHKTGAMHLAVRRSALHLAEQGNGAAARAAGAPPGHAVSPKQSGRDNLNALKHGHHSHPLPLPDLERLAAVAISGEPGDFAHHIDLAVRVLQSHTGWSEAHGDPFLTLVALRRLLSQLTALIAGKRFDAELQAAMGFLRAPARALLHRRIARHAARLDPEARLLLLRKIKTRKNKNNHRNRNRDRSPHLSR